MFQHSDSTIMVSAIEGVLSEWQSATGITMKLEETTDNLGAVNLARVEELNDPDRNVIYYDPNFSSGLTTQNKAKLDEGGEYYRIRRDIKIGALNYFYSETGNKPSGKADFRTAFAHEVGHALGLDHNIILDSNGDPDQSLMYYGITTAYLPYSSRILLSNGNGTMNATIGANDILDQSQDIIWTGGGISTLKSQNSTVLPTPSIKAIPPFPPSQPFGADDDSYYYMCPEDTLRLRSSASEAYFWEPTGFNTQIVNITHDNLGDHYVYLSNYPQCTVGSLPSNSVAALSNIRCELGVDPVRDTAFVDSIGMIDVMDFKVYPNPASDFLSIEYDISAPFYIQQLRLTAIRSSTAQIEIEIDLNTDTGTLNIPVNSIPNDTYFVQLRSRYGIHASKQIIVLH